MTKWDNDEERVMKTSRVTVYLSLDHYDHKAINRKAYLFLLRLAKNTNSINFFIQPLL